MIGVWLALLGASLFGSDGFRFAVIGDRTGEAQPGVYEAVWQAVDEERPDFAVNVGDSIQGGNDKTAMAEWRSVEGLWHGARNRFPLYVVPGNHDIWSDASARVYQRVTQRPLHYSFDYQQAHFTVLDNSRTEDLSAGELDFLEADLRAHRKQQLKFVLFHRPYWILRVLVRDPAFRLHRIVREFGVQYVICGHLHQMLHFELDGVQYVSVGSAGGHLRGDRKYEGGWFFSQGVVTVSPAGVQWKIFELAAPFGSGRETDLADWGPVGLQRK